MQISYYYGGALPLTGNAEVEQVLCLLLVRKNRNIGRSLGYFALGHVDVCLLSVFVRSSIVFCKDGRVVLVNLVQALSL